jgi:hypothetical protein
MPEMRVRLLTGAIVAAGALAASLLLAPAANASGQDDWTACGDPYCYAPTTGQLGFKVVATAPAAVTIGWNPGAYQYQNSGAPTACTIYTFDAATDSNPIPNPFAAYPNQPKSIYLPSHQRTIQSPGGGYRTDAIAVTPGESSYFQITCTNTFTVVENGETLSLEASGDWMLRASRIATDDVVPLAPRITAIQKAGTQGLRVAAEVNIAGKAGADQLEYRILRAGKTYRTDPIKFSQPVTNASGTSYQGEGLYNGTYTVQVRAHNRIGWGSYSNSSQAITITGNPEPTHKPVVTPPSKNLVKQIPTITAVKKHGAKSTVTWRSGTVLKTKVVIKLGSKTVLSKTVGAKTRSVSLKAKHGKTYTVRFTAYLRGGAIVVTAYTKKL